MDFVAMNLHFTSKRYTNMYSCQERELWPLLRVLLNISKEIFVSIKYIFHNFHYFHYFFERTGILYEIVSFQESAHNASDVRLFGRRIRSGAGKWSFPKSVPSWSLCYYVFYCAASTPKKGRWLSNYDINRKYY